MEEEEIIQKTAWGKNVETEAEKKERKKKNRKDMVKNFKENAKKFGEGLNKLAEGLVPPEEQGKKVDLVEELFGENESYKAAMGESNVKW